MSTPELTYRRNVVQPVESVKGAWALIKDQYPNQMVSNLPPPPPSF